MPGRTRRVLDRLAGLGRYRFNVVRGEDSAFLWPDWRPDRDLAAWLTALPAGATSGDLYARLDPGPGAQGAESR
jgi:hypothetical protein